MSEPNESHEAQDPPPPSDKMELYDKDELTALQLKTEFLGKRLEEYQDFQGRLQSFVLESSSLDQKTSSNDVIRFRALEVRIADLEKRVDLNHNFERQTEERQSDKLSLLETKLKSLELCLAVQQKELDAAATETQQCKTELAAEKASKQELEQRLASFEEELQQQTKRNDGMQEELTRMRLFWDEKITALSGVEGWVKSQQRKEGLERRASEIKEKYGFGKEAWLTYFGDVGEEPPVPINLAEILNQDCPFMVGKKIRETHLLVLIPGTLNGQPFTLNLLESLIAKPKADGYKTQISTFNPCTRSQIGEIAPNRSYWTLLTKGVLQGSRNMNYEDQKDMVSEKPGYDIPSTLEAATAILMHHVRTGEMFYPEGTWTRCVEQIDFNGMVYPAAVGCFSSEGLRISQYGAGCKIEFGVGCCRRLRGD